MFCEQNRDDMAVLPSNVDIQHDTSSIWTEEEVKKQREYTCKFGVVDVDR